MLKQIIITALKSKIGKKIIQVLILEFIEWIKKQGYRVERLKSPNDYSAKLLNVSDEELFKVTVNFYCQNELEKFNPEI